MITRHIADLLYNHECVIVPGLGGFIKASIPARIIHATNEFHPPSGTIAFNAGLAGNDGQLATYIASVENISYRDALNEIKSWSDKSINSIKNGDIVCIEGIGDLFLNPSGKFEFSPSMQINFNADSYGLPVFFAQTVSTETMNIPQIQQIKQSDQRNKYHRLIPETLKWAAVLAPFIAFTLWGSLNGNLIDNYVHNYTGMFSWARSTPGKTAPVNSGTYQVKVEESPSVVIQSPTAVLADENISLDPGMVSYTELAKNNISISGPNKVSKPESIAVEQDYFIIGGAFRDPDNAAKLIGILQAQGFPAAVVDTTPGGLYVVSMKGFTDYNEAVNQLDGIKKAGYSSSWILKRNRG